MEVIQGGRRGKRRYPKATKAAAVILAEQTSANAAADAMGIPVRSIGYWLDSPEFAEIRQRAKETWSEEVLVVARRAWQLIAQRLPDMADRDLIDVGEMATEKAQLLAGAATSRSEHRDLTENLADHEREALADAIDEWLTTGRAAEIPESPAG